MHITKNWFYNISELLSSPSTPKERGLGGEEEKISIWDNLQVAIFDDTKNSPLQRGARGGVFTIWENSTLEYFSFFAEEWIYNKHFICDKNNSKVIVKALIYSENHTIESTITWELAVNNTESYTDILSFAWENGEIKLDWILKIGSALQNVKWRLDEENIFLWESGKISGIPTLLVATNDVEASHSCRMEKISDEKLFYLRSRGVWKENALQMMIEAKIKNLYRCLEMYDRDFYREIIDTILKKIK